MPVRLGAAKAPSRARPRYLRDGSREQGRQTRRLFFEAFAVTTARKQPEYPGAAFFSRQEEGRRSSSKVGSSRQALSQTTRLPMPVRLGAAKAPSRARPSIPSRWVSRARTRKTNVDPVFTDGASYGGRVEGLPRPGLCRGCDHSAKRRCINGPADGWLHSARRIVARTAP
jgi:hypothetical protein